MPPGNSMGQMIQMLSVLSDIKDRRAQMDQQKLQFEEQKKQWAEQFGLSEDTHNINSFSKALEAIATGAAKPEHYDLMTRALRLTPEQGQALQVMGPNAATFLQQIQAQGQQQMQSQVQQGLASMTPQQRQFVQQNAASQAMTGQSMGDLSQGALIGTMAGNMNPQTVYGMDMLTKLGQGMATRMATGQTPGQYATDQYAVNTPGYIGSAARIAAGMDPTAGQSMSDRLGWYQANTNQMQGAQGLAIQAFAARNAAAGQGGGMSGMNAMLDNLRQLGLALGKSKSKAEMQMFAAQYNTAAALLGLPQFTKMEDLPNALGFLDRVMGHGPTGAVPQVQQYGPPPNRGPGGGQSYQPPPAPPIYQPPRY